MSVCRKQRRPARKRKTHFLSNTQLNTILLDGLPLDEPDAWDVFDLDEACTAPPKEEGE
jgi:hypothetical protein